MVIVAEANQTQKHWDIKDYSVECVLYFFIRSEAIRGLAPSVNGPCLSCF